MSGPLDGHRCLELVRVGPGAFCTMMLADMGAEVIKVEMPSNVNKAGGSAVSRSKQEVEKDPARLKRVAYNSTNRNKRSITINLRSEKGQSLLLKLAGTADILVEGFRPGVMKGMNCDYDTISKLNPRIVYASLTGYGQDGPYARLPGHDINYIAVAGALDLIGKSGQPPTIPLNLVADIASGALHSVIGILLALVARQRTGKGQFVDVSYLDGVVSMLGALPAVSAYLSQGTVLKRGETALSGAYPYYAVYRTKDDKFISIGCIELHFWQNLCEALGRPELGKYHYEPKHLFQKPVGDEWHQISEWLSVTFGTKTQEEWWSFLKDKDVCVTKVNDMAAVVTDPQVRHRGMIEEFDDPVVGPVRQIGIPIKLSDTPGSIRTLAPFLGQDTELLLKELGLSQRDINELRVDGVI